MNLWSGVSPEAFGQHPDRVDLLLAALQFNQDLDSLSQLRLTLMTDPDALPSLVVTADRRMLLSVLLARLEEKQLLDMPSGRIDPLICQLLVVRARFVERRRALLEGLREITKALNERDIVPLLLKGSVSLWNGSPSWRFQRDIDFLVEPPMAVVAHDILLSIGFEPTPEIDKVRHHLQSLIRDDIPATVEVHIAASHERGEGYLPTREIMANCQQSETELGTVFLPGEIDFMLHIVVHNHFTHRNATYGVLALKGLFEFAWQVQNSSDETVLRAYERARQNSRLLAAVDLWFAAIEADFGIRLPDGLTVPTDASLRWQTLRTRMLLGVLPNLVTAYREETGMVRARTGGMPDLVRAFWSPMYEILTAPIILDYRHQARKSAGIIIE